MISKLISGDKNCECRPTRYFPLRLHISFKVRLHKSKPLLYAALDISSTFFNISEDCMAVNIEGQGEKTTTYFVEKGRYLHLLHKISELQISTQDNIEADQTIITFMSRSWRTLGSYRAKIPSKISTWGE